MRIGYYLHHQGQGHRRRASAVARRLGVPVTGLGTGGAPEGWPGDWLELAADDEPAVEDPALADVEAGGVLHWVPRHHGGLLERHRQIVDWLAEQRPTLVVVDVSVEVTLLVRLCGIPVVVGGMPGERTDPVHALAYDVAEAILAPWPRDAHPGAGWPSAWWEKTAFVGGISALATTPIDRTGLVPAPDGDRTGLVPTPIDRTGLVPAPEESPRRVLVVWGSGGDPLPADALAAARSATPDWEWTVRGGGHPASQDLEADLLAANVVVCHAGQGSVADVAWARRPAVVLAQPRPFDEQDATVHALDRLGLAAVGHGWPAAHRWPGLLDRALELGGAGWSRWGADGAREAAETIQTLAERLGGSP